MKRIVSFVPSWTETLIEASVAGDFQVVGRTRFCIHPHERIRSIEVVGGTKDLNEEKLRALAPDIIIMDREENTRAMYEAALKIAPVLATHVTHVKEMPRELRELSNAIRTSSAADENQSSRERSGAGSLEYLAKQFEITLAKKPALHNASIPATIKILKGNPSTKDKFMYVIWQNPWMCVGKQTFIASMLERAGFDLENLVASDAKLELKNSNSNYPRLENLPSEATILLSSEPYPFAKKPPQLPNENVALVDGESYSWFGIRALRFLESLTNS